MKLGQGTPGAICCLLTVKRCFESRGHSHSEIFRGVRSPYFSYVGKSQRGGGGPPIEMCDYIFSCNSNGPCLNVYYLCLLYFRCYLEHQTDRKDEAVVIIDSGCAIGQRRCKTNDQCIHISKFCDGVRDCADGSDEDEDNCSELFLLLFLSHRKRLRTFIDGLPEVQSFASKAGQRSHKWSYSSASLLFNCYIVSFNWLRRLCQQGDANYRFDGGWSYWTWAAECPLDDMGLRGSVCAKTNAIFVNNST